MKNQKVRQAVILAGGRGTRLRPFTDNNSKAMYPINGEPFLGYLLKQMVDFGIEQVVLLLGYQADSIQDYVNNNWKNSVLDIVFNITPVGYDTGARIRSAQDILDDHFMLLYCDNYCNIEFDTLCANYFEHSAHVELSVYENKDNYTKSNLRVDNLGRVLCYDKNRQLTELCGVDIGYAIVNKRVVDLFPNVNDNFEKVVYPKLVEQGSLYATVTKHRYFSIGSWKRIALTEQFFGNVKTVFIDRDGTINVRPPRAKYVEMPEQFVWLPNAIDAIKLAKNAGYRIIMLTNQPGIARGKLTEKMLCAIHEKMQKDLHDMGCMIDAIYYCPHNWNAGCDCRKPNPGLFFQAEKDFSIDLSKCYMIGDDERDMEAAKRAGCKCILVNDTFDILEAMKVIIAEGDK